MKNTTAVIFFLAAALAACGGATVSTSSSSGVVSGPSVPGAALIIGGGSANFGIHQLTMGFMPDPHMIHVRSGGRLNASDAPTNGVPCNGWVTAQPDVIINFAEMQGFLRFGFRADVQGEDATILVNDGNGNWHCNDDGGNGLNPMVDLSNAPPGQYDIWVGSYSSGEYIDGNLMVSELTSEIP